MNGNRLTYDVMVLAAAMLPLLKAQARIDRTDEDQQATEIMARAIGRVERQSGICIAPQQWQWMPRDPTRYPYAATYETARWNDVQIPLRGWSTIEGKDAADVALTYTLTGDVSQAQFGRVWLQRSPDGVQASDLFTIDAGFTTPDDMPAELRDTLVRYAAALWENREAWGDTDPMPEWVTEALGIFWIPVV